MGKKSRYVTCVQFAVPENILPDIQKPLRRREGFKLVAESILSGDGLLDAVANIRPDILVLDLALPDLRIDEVLTTLGRKKIPPYVVATAPRHESLARIQAYPVVRGTLTRMLALSPLLRYVLAGIVEGCVYFSPAPSFDAYFARLDPDEVVLLALMAVGLQVAELMREFSCSKHVVYSAKCLLRKKLGVKTNEEAIVRGIRLGLIGTLTEASDRDLRKESA